MACSTKLLTTWQPQHYFELFPRMLVMDSRTTRRSTALHDMQLTVQHDGTQLLMFARSAFGLVKVWNALPSTFVHSSSVSAFQSLLTRTLKVACERGFPNWKQLFTPPFVSPRLVHFCHEALEVYKNKKKQKEEPGPRQIAVEAFILHKQKMRGSLSLSLVSLSLSLSICLSLSLSLSRFFIFFIFLGLCTGPTSQD